MSRNLSDLQRFVAENAPLAGAINCPSLKTTCGPSFTCKITTCSETVGN